MTTAVQWSPNPGPQAKFLASSATEALYGGAAGGGKTDALLMGALRNIHDPNFRALLLRRSFPELERSLIERSRTWYKLAGGEFNEARKLWRFPSGAVIEFGHVEHDHDVHAYQSAEYQFLGFDELTTFTERQYTYLISRARSAHGIPVRIRSATNPGGEGHDWVFRRWAPWLDSTAEYQGPRADPGQVLHYRNTEDGEQWCEPGQGTLSRQFCPARATDNPHLMVGDPGYLDRLGSLDLVTRKQLRDGDWLVRPGSGLLFKREWLEVVDLLPAEKRPARVRYWDRAASQAGDWTVGVLLSGAAQGVYYVEDVVRFRGTPALVEARIKSTAELDGRQTMIGIEQDPGQAGVFEADYYVKQLAGYNVRAFRPTGDKITRAQPVSAQAERRNLKVLRAPWNAAFIAELEAFPDDAHDDQVDALSGAFAAISQRAHIGSYMRAMEKVKKGDLPSYFQSHLLYRRD
jgi:predicted phage terminase large subunit-like protein